MVKLALRALPPYAGGKRRLLGAIFGAVPSPEQAPVFADAFLGGGSVSLTAKARGYRVLANDVAERSTVVARALVENDRTELSHEDLVLLATPQDQRAFAQEHLAPHVFPLEYAVCMDNVLANAERLRGAKRWLARLLVVKMALRCRPLGNFGARKVMEQVASGDWEQMKPAYARDLINRGLGRHPLRMAELLRRQINRGVFSNSQVNEVYQGDAVEFLSRVQADIVYLDPPYAGTQSYEQSLRPLDELLAGRRLEVEVSRFSTGDPRAVLDPLFEAAAHIDTVALSYGNAVLELPDLLDIVRRHRPEAEGRAIRYTHFTGLASQESRQRNRELLIVARRVS